MGDTGQPPPGGGSQGVHVQQSNVPDQRIMTNAWAAGGVSGGRNFSKIIEDEQRDRNILELKISKIDIEDDNGAMTKPRPLTFEDLGEFLFDTLEINPTDCVTFNFSTGRYDQREIKFKPGVDTNPFLREPAVTFKNHSISVRKQRQGVVKVTFKNVPLNVPDEEILNLCNSYGKPVGNVYYEKLQNIRGFVLTGSTRFVDVEMEQGISFENYYWLEGPLPGDIGKRIVVLHNNQPPQCSHCLRRAGLGCPAMGNGKACERTGTGRARMNEYMESLKKKIGYTSLKIKHAENQARMFPSLLGIPGEKSSEQEVEKVWAMDEKEDEYIMVSPIEERDRIIEKQREEISKLKEMENTNQPMKEDLAATKAENEKLLKSIQTYEKKILYARNVTEQKLYENLEDPAFFQEDPHLVSLYSATLNEDEIITDIGDSNSNDGDDDSKIRSRKDKFFANVEKKLDTNDPRHSLQLERLDNLKNQVLEKIKITHNNKMRPRTGSSAKRRLSLSLNDETDRSHSRPRTGSPTSATTPAPTQTPPPPHA